MDTLKDIADSLNIYYTTVSKAIQIEGVFMMTPEYYERIRDRLYAGQRQNPFLPLLRDRAGISEPVQGTVGEFSQIVYELTAGEPNKKNGNVAYQLTVKGKRDILKFSDGTLFSLVKVRAGFDGLLIVVTPFKPVNGDQLDSREMPGACRTSTRS